MYAYVTCIVCAARVVWISLGFYNFNMNKSTWRNGDSVILLRTARYWNTNIGAIFVSINSRNQIDVWNGRRIFEEGDRTDWFEMITVKYSERFNYSREHLATGNANYCSVYGNGSYLLLQWFILFNKFTCSAAQNDCFYLGFFVRGGMSW